MWAERCTWQQGSVAVFVEKLQCGVAGAALTPKLLREARHIQLHIEVGQTPGATWQVALVMMYRCRPSLYQF